MELRHLRYFVRVAEELSFRRAAELLRVAQPSLGRQIRDLEDEVGAQLLERDRHHVALTDAGHVLLAEARLLLAHADRAITNTRDAARGKAGILRIGNIGQMTLSFLPTTLAAFRKAYPRVEIDVRELGPDQQRAALLDGSIHVGFHRAGHFEADPRIVHRPVVTTGAWVILPPEHPLAEKRIVPVAALADESFLTYRPLRGAAHDSWVAELCRTYGGFTPKVRRKTSDEWVTIFGMVAAGEGITVTPTVFVKEAGTNRNWVARRLRVPRNVFEVSAMWRAATAESELSPLLANYLPLLPHVQMA